MSVVPEPFADSLESIRVPHTLLEDALGYVTSIVVTSLGLYLIQSVGDKEHHRDIYMQVADERLVVNDKHTVRLYE